MFPDEVMCISQYLFFFFIGFQIILSTCLLHMEILRKMFKKKSSVTLQRKSGSKSSRSQAWWLLSESPGLSGTGGGCGVFALTLPCWVILAMSFYVSGFAQQFLFTKPVNSIGPFQDGDKEKKWKVGCLHSSLLVHPDGQCSRRRLYQKPGGQTPATLNSRNSRGIVKRAERKGAWINPSLIPQKPLPCRTPCESYALPCHAKLLPRCLQRLQGVNRVIKRVAIRVAHPSNLKFPV